MKTCPGYYGYSVMKNGRVFSHRKRFGLGRGRGGGVRIDRNHCKELKPSVGHGNYLYVSISTNRGQRSIPIHLLLLDAFVGPRPKNMETRHLDGNPQNNKLSNLKYGTRKCNAYDRVRHGRQKGREILSNNEVRCIRWSHEKGDTIASIAKILRISEYCVHCAVHRKTYKHIA